MEKARLKFSWFPGVRDFTSRAAFERTNFVPKSFPFRNLSD
jgi:hypothetical protein